MQRVISAAIIYEMRLDRRLCIMRSSSISDDARPCRTAAAAAAAAGGAAAGVTSLMSRAIGRRRATLPCLLVAHKLPRASFAADVKALYTTP